MFPGGMFALLKQVISSWQVLVITVAIIVYLQIVFYMARANRYRRPRERKIKMKRVKQDPVIAAGPEEINESADSNDELGLEESE